MTGRVFQVDDTKFLVPYTYEVSRLSEAGITLIEGFCESPEDVVSRAVEADVLWLSWNPHIDRAILEQLPQCRLVIRWGIGYEQIDLEAATDLGIAVANAPTYGTEDVAEHTLALLLALERRLVAFDGDMRRGGWSTPQAGSIRRIRGRTVGLIGVGRIGAAFARRAQGIGLEVIGHDAYRSDEEFAAIEVERVPLDELARRSDYVSIHVPHTPETEAMVDRAFFSKMKPSSYLINTSRGKVVNEPDLIHALTEGVIAGAGLDVFWTEPLPADSPLRAHPNVIITPHFAGYSADSWSDLREEMCRTTIDFLTTGWAETIVNPGVRPRLRSVPALP
ncbi:MAG TPA: C-terminal binding protein [Acidimicrobiia bacterium]|nr:C-terminal binding protein [Acidimicrobiia bacterium]